ncbi:MAG: adenylate kinase [Acidobacteria bacterium]|nr:adenylate kinase [Acidobacteriota bacterium]
MRLVLFGPPGAGKGTQATRIAAAWGVPHVSTGAMLRDAVSGGTALGTRVKDVMDRGLLVSDDLIGEVVEQRLRQPDARRGFLLDGFPRTPRQVEILDRILSGLGATLDRVVLLEVPERVVLQRLAGRAAAGDGGTVRADDNEDTIRERMRVYRAQTEPVADIYRRRGILAEIDGTGTIDEVFAAVASELKGQRA